MQKVNIQTSLSPSPSHPYLCVLSLLLWANLNECECKAMYSYAFVSPEENCRWLVARSECIHLHKCLACGCLHFYLALQVNNSHFIHLIHESWVHSMIAWFWPSRADWIEVNFFFFFCSLRLFILWLHSFGLWVQSYSVNLLFYKSVVHVALSHVQIFGEKLFAQTLNTLIVHECTHECSHAFK